MYNLKLNFTCCFIVLKVFINNYTKGHVGMGMMQSYV